MQKRKLEELNLLDDFLFGSMVTHPEVGEKFVKMLLKIIFGREFSSLKNVTVIMIVPFDPFGYDRMVYTITRSCKEVPEMPYDDGSRTLYLYTRGKEGDISEELKQFLRYMEATTRENAVNEELREIQQMVERVKTDEGVSIEYMKSYERDWMMRKEGREEERVNTERERKRAEKATERAEKAEAKVVEATERAEEAEARIKQLQEELERIKKGTIS